MKNASQTEEIMASVPRRSESVNQTEERTNHRAPKLVRGDEYIRKNCREEYAEDLLWRNAEKFLKV